MFESFELSEDHKNYRAWWMDLGPRQKLGMVSLVFSVIFGLIGVFGFIWQANFQSDPVCFYPELDQATPSAMIWVDIGGAVEKPGIYRLSYGARLADLVNQAGGFSKQADKYYLNKQLNLAQRLVDGAKIYIPTSKELELVRQAELAKIISPTNQDQNSLVDTSAGAQSTQPATRVSINQASLEELMSLQGVGEVRANKIINHRPFSSLDELVTKKILPESVYTKNRPLLVL